ncbi:hypothetical protein N7507_006505 [Penicillium longicatenatum]|nr:hypothetical protein N7507_006505 [Penicillium longicatenatum]
MATSDPPPPYQAHDPSTPAAQTPIATFHIDCPMQRNYHIYTGPNKNYCLKAQANEFGINCDLAFYRSNAPHRELISCNFKETTMSVDKASIRTPTGKLETIWWAAGLDPKIPISVKYRFLARLRNPADPLAIISDPVNSVSSQPFYWKGGSDWMLFHEASGTVAAVVRDVDLTAGKYGSLEFLVSYGDTFPTTVLSTYLTVCEKLKREAKRHTFW